MVLALDRGALGVVRVHVAVVPEMIVLALLDQLRCRLIGVADREIPFHGDAALEVWSNEVPRGAAGPDTPREGDVDVERERTEEGPLQEERLGDGDREAIVVEARLGEALAAVLSDHALDEVERGPRAVGVGGVGRIVADVPVEVGISCLESDRVLGRPPPSRRVVVAGSGCIASRSRGRTRGPSRGSGRWPTGWSRR